MTKKTYDIRNIDELHMLRSDLYEERKHLPLEEQVRISNEVADRVLSEIEAIRQNKSIKNHEELLVNSD